MNDNLLTSFQISGLLTAIFKYHVTLSSKREKTFLAEPNFFEIEHNEENGYFFNVGFRFDDDKGYESIINAKINIKGNRMCIFTDYTTEIYQIKDQILHNFLLYYDETKKGYTYLAGRRAEGISSPNPKEEINLLTSIMACEAKAKFQTSLQEDAKEYQENLMTR